MELGLPLILVAAALFIVGLLLRRVRPDKKAVLSGTESPQKPSMFGGRSREALAPQEPDFSPPRPPVAAFDVEDGIAKVTFSVPVPANVDEVLRDVLMTEAIEVVRERRHGSAVPPFTEIAVYAGVPASREIASRSFPDGVLPEPSSASMLNLSAIALDPLEVLVNEGPSNLDLPTRTSGDKVGPIGPEIRVPKAIDTGLRAQGIDPSSMTAAQLVTGMLSLVGYTVSPGVADHTWFAQKGGERTFIREEPSAPTAIPKSTTPPSSGSSSSSSPPAQTADSSSPTSTPRSASTTRKPANPASASSPENASRNSSTACRCNPVRGRPPCTPRMAWLPLGGSPAVSPNGP